MNRALLGTLVLVAAVGARAADEERWRVAVGAIRDGDPVAGVRTLWELAGEEMTSPSLFWNWAQAAAARGEVGEAIWALLRCQELDPGDPAARRELERLRQIAQLSPAETAPQPWGELARQARRWRAGTLAVIFFALSLLGHAAARWLLPAARWPVAGAWVAFVLAMLLSVPTTLVPWVARPLATVVRAGAPLLDAASPHAGTLATLRVGEVVPILTRSGRYLRIQDSSGARGWALVEQVWPLEELPPREALP